MATFFTQIIVKGLVIIIVFLVTLLVLPAKVLLQATVPLVFKMQLFNQIKHAFATKAFHEILFVLETSLVPLCL